jgi:hypothetical protein
VRSDRERLLDIMEAVERIEKYADRGRQAIERDELLQTWFVHHVQIIGEAAAKLSEELRTAHPDVQGQRSSACGTCWFMSTSAWTLRRSGPRFNTTFPD